MSLIQRAYTSYADYVRLQGLKATRERVALLATRPKALERFTHDFQSAQRHLRPGPVLCLGARTGAEVLAFARAGFTGSVGIDLYPIGDCVIHADWHALPFVDASVPNVYTNSLDHCLYLDRLATEVHRVLVPKGIFYVMASDRPLGKNSQAWLTTGGQHEALFWDQADDLCHALASYHFAPIAAWRVGVWSHFILMRVES